MNQHWHVLGAGSIGCLFASRLQSAGYDVTLLTRHSGALEHREITLLREGQDKEIRRFPQLVVEQAIGNAGIEKEIIAKKGTETYESPLSINKLLITTKSFDVINALKPIVHMLSDDASIVLLVNGMGIAEALAPLLDLPNNRRRLLIATTTSAAFSSDKDSFTIVSEGKTELGAFDHRTQPDWWSDWQAAVPNSTWSNAIENTLFTKLAINCAINPLSARNKIRNGELLNQPYRAEFEAVIQEIITRLARLERLPPGRDLAEVIRGVAHSTSGNTSSMLADLMGGRTMELDAILGYFLFALAQQAGAPLPEAPILSRLYRELSERQPTRHFN